MGQLEWVNSASKRTGKAPTRLKVIPKAGRNSMQIPGQSSMQLNRLYGLRSDVTHRGAVTFDEFDIRLLMGLASEAVMILLTRPPYKDFENEEQFIEYVNNLKYSAPAPPSSIRCEGTT